MDDGTRTAELERLADEARAARERLAELRRNISELAASLPPPNERAEPNDEAGPPHLQSVP